MDALRLGPSDFADLDALASPSRTRDLLLQLRLHASYLTLHLVRKLNGDKRAQHFLVLSPHPPLSLKGRGQEKEQCRPRSVFIDVLVDDDLEHGLVADP